MISIHKMKYMGKSPTAYHHLFREIEF